MALQVSHRTAGYRQDVIGQLGGMEGNEELEEGEACDTNDPNYGSDLYFPHLELKLTEVLGHARKDFEGGIYAEKLGSKFGGYGTFLPTVPAAAPPPAASGNPSWNRRLSPCAQIGGPSPGNSEAVKQATDVVKEACDIQSKVPHESCAEIKKTSSITLRIKMGPESRGKNAAIYNRLGFSSPSVSEDEEDDDASGPESSPDRSPASMIQIILSYQPPTDGLLSPLPDLVLRSEKPVRTGEVAEVRKQSKHIKVEKDSLKDTLTLVNNERKDTEVQVRQDIKREKIRDKAQEETVKFVAAEDFKGFVKTHEHKDPALEVGKVVARKDKTDLAATSKDGIAPKHNKGRKEESFEMAESRERATDIHPEKRKSKDSESERLKKRHKSASSTGSIDTKEGKKSRKHSASAVGEDNMPAVKSKDDKKKERNVKLSVVAERDQDRKPCMDEFSGNKKKLKVAKKNKDARDFHGREPLDKVETKVSEPVFQQAVPINPETGLPPPAIINEDWVQCEECHQWRLLPPSMDPPNDDRWHCEMITWLPPGMNDCRFSEEETTNAVYASLGLATSNHHVDPSAAAPSTFVPAAVAGAINVAPTEVDAKSGLAIKTASYTKKATKSNLADCSEEANLKLRAADVKPGKHVVKKKEKLKQPEVDEFDQRTHKSAKDKEGLEAKEAKRKKRALYEETQTSKKIKAEGNSPQRSKYAHAELPSENADEDADSYDRVVGRKQIFDMKCPKKVVVDESKKERRAQDAEGSHTHRKTTELDHIEHEQPCRTKPLNIRSKEWDDESPRKPSKDYRKGPADHLEVKQELDKKDASALASNAIKAATNLKHTADRLKDETATDIYLQAALKFLQGAALMESVLLYNDTALLFKYCASQYERANDMAGAVLAYKCAAVARFRLLMVKIASMSRDRTDLQTALHRAPAANQTGESPSSSSASDLDNLNSQAIPVEKMFSVSGKGAASPLVQGSGSMPAALQPTLARFIRNTSDVFEAFEIWNKADSVLATIVAGESLSSDKLAAVERVGSIGFSDVEALVRLVNQALEALGR